MFEDYLATVMTRMKQAVRSRFTRKSWPMAEDEPVAQPPRRPQLPITTK